MGMFVLLSVGSLAQYMCKALDPVLNTGKDKKKQKGVN